MTRRQTTERQDRWGRRATGTGRAVLAAALLLGLTVGGGAGAPAPTERVSVSSTGEQANGPSSGLALSADGRFVAFDSSADNLVAGDTNNAFDVFVRDRLAGTTERVSVSSTGAQGNGGSSVPALSADGRFVAFDSSASNLVPGDTNATSDVFVRDRLAGTTERVNLSSTGAQGNEVSSGPALSADGRLVAFHSWDSNLVPGDTNRTLDVFVRDRQPAAVVVTLALPTARPVARTLSGLTADQRVVRIQNGTPGLGSVRLTVNGRVLPIVILRDGEARTLDVARYLKPGANNTIRLETSWGTPGAIGGSAVITVRP